MRNREVYYKVYYLEKEGYVTVVCMQCFDEGDYTEEYFFKDEEGNVLKFEWENDAIKWIIDNIEDSKIDPAYRHKGFNQKKFMKTK